MPATLGSFESVANVLNQIIKDNPPPPNTGGSPPPPPKVITTQPPPPPIPGGVPPSIGGAAAVTLGGSVPGLAAAAGAIGIGIGLAIGSYWDEINTPPVNGPPMPANYNGAVPVAEPDPKIEGYHIEGVYIDGDGFEHGFIQDVGSKPAVFTTNEPHGQGGSNGIGAVGSLDANGNFTDGGNFYSSNCRTAKCGLVGYRIDKLIPRYGDGTSGANQANGAPVSAPSGSTSPVGPAAPAVDPNQQNQSSPRIAPGTPLAPGQSQSNSSTKQTFSSAPLAPGQPQVEPPPTTQPPPSTTEPPPPVIPPQIIKFPDGTTVQYKADGSITFNTPGGATSTIAPPTTAPTAPPGKAPTAPPGKAPSKTPTETEADKNNPFILPNVPLFPGAAPGTTPQQTPFQPASANCQPGTCSGAISSQVNANGIQAQQNNAATNYWGALNYALNTQQVSQLSALQASNATVLSRLGPQVGQSGGIGGVVSGISTGLTNFTKWSVVDRLINLVILTSVLHNAYMLSAGLKATLLEMVSSLGNSTGLLQDSEGGNVDLNEAFNTGVESFLKLLLGEPTVDGIKKTWKKYNRVYQAAASMINSVQSMVNGLANVIEITAEYTGKVGNALKAAGAVAEKAYNWLPEQVSARTGKLAAVQKFGETVGDVSNLFDNVNEASQSVVEIQEQATELVKQNTEFKKALKEADLAPGVENEKVKTKAAIEKTNAKNDQTESNETALKRAGDG